MEIEDNIELEVKENAEAEENAQSETTGLPPLDPTIAQQVLSLLNVLVGLGSVPTISIGQDLVPHPVTATSSYLGRTLGDDVLFCPPTH